MDQPNVGSTFRPQGIEAGVHLYLSSAEGDIGALFGQRVCGLPITLSLCPVTEWIDAADVAASAVAVVQVDADSPASIKRFEKLAEMSRTPLIAATYEPPLALVRSLLKSGAHDVVPLPLTLEELEASVTQVRAEPEVQAATTTPARTAHGKLVLFIKSRGGIGATAIASQLACRYAAAEARAHREACLIDLDIQFGDAAFQLGLHPRLSVCDLVEAGARLDGQLLRSVAAVHPSGLNVVAAPGQLMPLDAVSSDQVIAVIDRATREFGTVFVDLPANWTNWSLSLIARADKILLVTELSVAALNRARRQLDLLSEQDLGKVPLQLVVNRNVRKLLGGGSAIKLADVEQALGRAVDFTVTDDPEVLAAAIERGVPLDEIRRKSAIGKDLDTISAALAADFGLER
ncbi:hypothetical protein OMW55_05075 [Sphingomonas sp. BN140010]|uniref:Pilus assembly protein CpaE n=1 Tax=Sphingomonas arvum TaxID=2992113 RepID=A0ABT3JDN1_9SPHN|nr:hypothetical protein [Sphingomonas sp. BN140010]MCW3797180.1 hypothetical protein [Sphingomonas sp. BN140010]